ANLVSAAFVFFFFGVLGKRNSGAAWDNHDTTSVIVFGVYVLLVGFVNVRGGARELTDALRWYEEDRSPDERELCKTLAIPSVLARSSFSYWVLAALLFGALNVVFGNTVLDVVRIVVGVLIGGLTSSAVVYLMVERRMRGVFAVALRDTELR